MTTNRQLAHGYPPVWKVEGEVTYRTPSTTLYVYDSKGNPQRTERARESKIIPMLIHGNTVAEVRDRYARVIPQVCPEEVTVEKLVVYNTHPATLVEKAQTPKSFEEIPSKRL
ncbi:MAG: hypothetical protein AABX11_03460 [Nanoarchaeota archaeon]